MYFKTNYCNQIDELKKRCTFVVDAYGDFIGSCIAWHDLKDNDTVASLHWLVVSPKHQGKHIGLALSQKVMNIFNDRGETPVYIHTQPWSYKAILLYIKLGFKIQKTDTFSRYENQHEQAIKTLVKLLSESQFNQIILSLEKNTMDIFDKICLQLDLGEIITQPTQLKGGFMHKMYSLFTTKGKYAIKLLNPYVMKRDTVFENFRIAEELEEKFEETDIPILPALTFNGKKMQEIDGQYFYLFDFYEGKSLKGEEITIEHCRKIGKFLAKIHNIEKKAQAYNRSEINVDWDMLIEKLSKSNTELYNLINANRDILYESQQKGNLATKKMPPILTICHNDMDSKNVLWNGDDCRIIDLECLCYSSPFVELYEMALCWSGYENCNIDFELFKALIKSYADNGGVLPDDWETIYYSSYGRLEWLEYNVKRALGIDCGEDEIEIGISEVCETMEHIVYYCKCKNDILESMK